MRLNNTIKVSALFLIAILLCSCGGGGGGGSATPPATVTITCPNGTSQTAATQALADAACPAPTLVSVTPADGSTTVSPDTLTNILATTDSTLDATSLTTTNVTLKAGNVTPVSGVVAISGTKAFTFTPAAKLNYSQPYSFSATVKDALGKTLTVSTSFTTAAAPTVTITCPNGTSQTAATQALAEAACPAPTLVSIAPANASTTASPDTLTAILATTDSLLDATTLTTVNVTLKAGGTVNVAGTVAISGTKAFTFTPTAKLLYSQAYNFAASVKDTLGKTLTIATTFTTSAVVCADPLARINSQGTCVSPPAATGYTWNDIIKAWVADIGVLVTGANTLPAACVTVGDACWLASVADGTIKFVNSGVVMTGLNTRPINFAIYMTNIGGVVGYNKMPMYADVIATSALANQAVNNSSSANISTDYKGSALGVKYTVPTQGCFERVFVGAGFGTNTTTCPI